MLKLSLYNIITTQPKPKQELKMYNKTIKVYQLKETKSGIETSFPTAKSADMGRILLARYGIEVVYSEVKKEITI